MNNKYILILLFLCACFYKNNNIINDNSKFTFKVVNFNVASTDSIESKLFIKVPLNPLVFKKIGKQFESNLEISIKVEDPNTSSQISRFSWQEKIINEFYNSTRNKESHSIIYKSTTLKSGHYIFIVTIKDLDSHRKWKIKKDVNINSNSAISDLIPYYQNSDKIVYIGKKVPMDVDTIFIDFQINSSIKNYKVQQNLFYNKKLIMSGNPLFTKKNSIMLPVDINWNGIYDYYVICNNDTSNFNFIFYNSEISLWSDDINELVGVMSYILDYSDTNQFNSLNKSQKLKYISDYWDIDNSSKSKPLLLELNNRFNYVNQEFSIADFIMGWETDRGRLYIVKGKPKKIESKFSYETNRNYEIWYYQGEQFVFVEMAMGDYSLQK